MCRSNQVKVRVRVKVSVRVRFTVTVRVRVTATVKVTVTVWVRFLDAPIPEEAQLTSLNRIRGLELGAFDTRHRDHYHKQ